VTIFLRLGYIYLFRKAWGDAKAIFARSVESKPNSSLAWLGLGISNLRIGELKEVIEINCILQLIWNLNQKQTEYSYLFLTFKGWRSSISSKHLRSFQWRHLGISCSSLFGTNYSIPYLMQNQLFNFLN